MPTRIDHYSIALVDNLETDIDEVNFSDNLRIIRLDLITEPRAVELLGEETFKVAQQIQAEGPLDQGRYRTAPYRPSTMMHQVVNRVAELSNHALEWRFASEVADPFNENYGRGRPMKFFSDVITSLRLLKAGLVGRFTSIHIIDGDPSGLEVPWSKGEILFYQPSRMNMHDRYVLLKDNVENLKRRIFPVVNKCENQRILIALTRFNRQYDRENDIDRLIDIVIGFESLYLSKDANAKNKKRPLAKRAVTHLGKNPNQRKRICECLSSAYRLRNQIVHGETQELRNHKILQKMDWNSPYAMLEELLSLLRRAILSILQDVGEEKFSLNFHKKLDNALITGQEFLGLKS